MLVLAAGFAMLSGCATRPLGSYSVTAYKPRNPGAVRVKVSLSKQNIYVMEGDRCLMAVATCVGTPDKPTPSGNFRIYKKIRNKRSYSYGFSVNGSSISPTTAGNATGRYVGYPMAYWCEFAPLYGIHEGFVHAVPRTHGCLRLHREAAARFFELVQLGTPVSVAYSQPEDAVHGSKVRRLNQANDPDPDPRHVVSESWFRSPPGPLLIEQ